MLLCKKKEHYLCFRYHHILRVVDERRYRSRWDSVSTRDSNLPPCWSVQPPSYADPSGECSPTSWHRICSVWAHTIHSLPVSGK